MSGEILSNASERMDKAVMAMRHEFAAVRTGRASTAILDRLQVDYYGTMTPLNQIAGISVPEAQLLIIQPWDKSALGAIEKAIQQSDLGLSPSNDGNVIRLAFPPLSEERRRDLVKLIKKQTEEGRVAVRNIRRDANEHIKAKEKDHEVSEDEAKRAEDEVQKVTDKHIALIDELSQAKEAEIMQV